MREAIARAEVGDEQVGDDPTVNLLCERVADLLGKEAAVFLPSGTMCNVAGILSHCRPGDEILAHETAHILTSEGGVHAALGGFQITPLKGDNGQYSVDSLRAAFRVVSRYAPPQKLVCVEQTANIGGGTIWPKATLDEIARVAKAQGLVTHMDGARLLNACVATGIAARDMAAPWDSVWIDFTKGLGAPIGAALAGSRDFIDQVWRWKQRLGGALRQGGIAAAGCLHALDHHVDRLADDHANARTLARGLSQIEGLDVQQPETNLVYIGTEERQAHAGQAAVGASRPRRAGLHARRPRPRLHPPRRQRGDGRGDGGADAGDRARVGLTARTERSPDGAKRNPGILVAEQPRISLRSIRATASASPRVSSPSPSRCRPNS